LRRRAPEGARCTASRSLNFPLRKIGAPRVCGVPSSSLAHDRRVSRASWLRCSFVIPCPRSARVARLVFAVFLRRVFCTIGAHRASHAHGVPPTIFCARSSRIMQILRWPSTLCVRRWHLGNRAQPTSIELNRPESSSIGLNRPQPTSIDLNGESPPPVLYDAPFYKRTHPSAMNRGVNL